MAEVKEEKIDLGDGVVAKIGKEYVELFKATRDFPLTVNQARRLAAHFAKKIMRN
jgi:hypothetical protein